ncbi:hypothetical protein [Salinicoccus halitifaciens]|uniref:Uncharacterized protein n=1 Tax=Salinicoccus halitifaciens TaxID=1073415 RepID=A0ABV2EC89_9STAP|nr:hypothetical protein [Salinicoccus halitifaciens]MCD2138798.1 hypothetical protein [Salinicoccus halitifaciens]
MNDEYSITLVLIVLISILGLLEEIYKFFQFLYINFSFPLLVDVVIIFNKELRNLINRIFKIIWRNNSIELNFVKLRKNSTLDQYSDVRLKELPPMGDGGGSLPAEDAETPAFLVLYNDSMFEHYLKKSGSIATIQKMYKAYEKALMNHYELYFAGINSVIL